MLFIEPPKFLKTPLHGSFGTQTVNIGGANDATPTCLICFNCSVSGTPPPTVTWEYQSRTSFRFNPVTTNRSNSSSSYYLEDNGQVSINAILDNYC